MCTLLHLDGRKILHPKVQKWAEGGGRLPKDMCKICHERGHWGSICPTKGTTPLEAEVEVATNAREVHSASQLSETYIEISVKGKKCNALNDTGSDRSLMPRRLVASALLKPSDIKLYAANNTEITNLWTMEFKYHVEGMAMRTELIVSGEIDELIIGFDWLIANECHWHFKDRVIYARASSEQRATRMPMYGESM